MKTIEKLLILFFALQSNEKFVHIQTIVIATFWAVMLMTCLWGAFNLFAHVFCLITENL